MSRITLMQISRHDTHLDPSHMLLELLGFYLCMMIMLFALCYNDCKFTLCIEMF